MKKILLVEDSQTQAARLQFLLTQNGYEAKVASNGFDALEECAKESPDLLVSDVTMPKMDGYELCTEIKKNPQTSDIPVMLLTGLSDPKDIVYGLEAGADCYLTKPYTDEELLSRIEFVLNNSKNEDDQAEEKTAIEVSFLGQRHHITSNRRQILGLLLSTYESAARRNKQLDKSQLKMKIELKDAARRAEAAEAALTIARVESDERTENVDRLFDAIPFPSLLYDSDDKLVRGNPESEPYQCEYLQELRTKGFLLRERSLEYEGIAHKLVVVVEDTPGGGGVSEQAPAMSADPEASEVPIPSDFQIERAAKLALAERLCERINRDIASLTEAVKVDSTPDSVAATCRSLTSLDLLNWSEFPSAVLRVQSYSLTKVLESIYTNLSLKACYSARGMELKVELPDSPCEHLGDPVRVLYTVREILDNAGEFANAQSTVTMSLNETDETYVISIASHGTAPETIAGRSIFEPFVTSRPDRLGVGLALAQKTCRSHGGEVTTSIDDRGRFTVVLALSKKL